ncbi:MAG: pur operon repressor [Firmicutes bacterium]|nr:pur operon repressor [Bacillota bacterium]
MKRADRLAAIVQRLLERPGQLHSLTQMSEELGVAKSTISEDLARIRQAFAEAGLGRVETFAGVNGGVRYLPLRGEATIRAWAEELRALLQQPDRVLPGGLIYLVDVLFNPLWAQRVGETFASWFHAQRVEYVLTVETRGVPLALFTAWALGCPMVLARRNSRATEGSAVSIHYASTGSDRIQTMSLARRALPPGSRVLVVDDFMRGGGSVRAMCHLLEEFEAEVAGVAVMIATSVPEEKEVPAYEAMLVLEDVTESHGPRLRLGDRFREG